MLELETALKITLLFHTFITTPSFQINSIAQAGREKRNSGDLAAPVDPKADARWAFYFYTSTVIATKTSITKSYTLTIATCTPAAALLGISLCG